MLAGSGGERTALGQCAAPRLLGPREESQVLVRAVTWHSDNRVLSNGNCAVVFR
ncbi:hypothetical protein RKE32_37555 [Streptomyces sp. Li-HN-5-13]|nr:hypothetical protein RKE32_37555 [Streptomyces sp. Li-HN-5-13]